MNATMICLVMGLSLGFAAAFGGLGAFAVVLIFGGLGLLIGRWLDGDVDLSGLLRSAQDRGQTVTGTVELPGTTTIDERVVRRIAARAATEVAGVESQPQVRAEVVGTGATLHVQLPLRYPLPIARVTEQCRAHLIARTEELTGMTVPRVDIEISAMVPEPSERRVR